MKYLISIILFVSINISAYSQENMARTIVKNKWVADCIEQNCDTINITRIIPSKKYEYEKVMAFDDTRVHHYYHFNPKPKDGYFVCGTGELELTEKSTYSIIAKDMINLVIDANILTDDFYTFKYSKDFKIQRISKNQYKLICVKTDYYKKNP